MTQIEIDQLKPYTLYTTELCVIVGTMKNCRICQQEFVPTAQQIKKYDWACRSCGLAERSAYQAKWITANRPSVLAYRKNPANKLRKATYRAFHKIKGAAFSAVKPQALIGCSIADFVKHVENKFLDGMSWENRSEWHLDHVIPLRTARGGTMEELKGVMHYTNCQPLWSKDNLSKSDKLPKGGNARSIVKK